MKRLIFSIALVATILISGLAQAQTPTQTPIQTKPDLITPEYEQSFQTISLASFNNDTLAYIKYNWAYSNARRYQYRQPGMGLFFREFEAKITAIQFRLWRDNIEVILLHYAKPYEAIKDLEYGDFRQIDHSILIALNEEMYISRNELITQIPELRYVKYDSYNLGDLILPWKEAYRDILGKYHVAYIISQELDR